jgi:hypothetical protein
MLALAASAVALPAVPVIASSDSWVGTSDGNWTDGTRWSNTVPPVAGDDVYITNAFSGTQTISYDFAGASTFSSVTVDATSGGTNVLSIGANTLTVGNSQFIGFSGDGAVNQSGGNNSLPGNSQYTYTPSTGNLDLGHANSAIGNYTMSSGNLSVSGAEFVGNGGSGTFNQSGGTNTLSNVSGSVYLGNAVGSTGTYTLSGGMIANASAQFVGYNGVGNFTQSGGNNQLLYDPGAVDENGFNGVYLGFNSGSTGTYTLSAGTLTLTPPGNSYYAEEFVIGRSGVGIFNQTGGTSNLSALHFTSNLYLGYNAGSSGFYSLAPGANLSVIGNEWIGLSGIGDFNQSGGTNAFVNTTLPTINPIGLILAAVSNSTGNYTLSGGDLSAGGSEFIGVRGSGNFVQTGGTNAMNSSAYLVLGSNTFSVGNYSLGPGALLKSGRAGFEVIGNYGTGNFVQTGGTHNSGPMYLGYQLGSSGSYSLSAGTINCSGPENIGNSGVGIFNQTGGINNDGYSLNIGNGTYTLGVGAILNVVSTLSGSENVGPGLFNQTGGNNNALRLYLYATASGTGTYTLSSGTLNIANSATYPFIGTELIGTGCFNQTGGANLLSGDLNLAEAMGDTGSYSLSGGAFSVNGNVFVGGKTNSSGGIGTLIVNGSGQLNVSNTLQIYGEGNVSLSNPSTAYSTVGNLQIAPGGLLDVTNTALTINYGSNASPNVTIRSYISNGYNIGSSLWTGKGITSTSAAADPGHHSVAFADGADGVVTNLPAGISSSIPNGGVLPADTELVTYAYAGDANLDGKVDFNDFVAISTHFLANDINWDHGNFNYDGVIDFNDFVILSTNFGDGVTGGDGVGATPEELAQFNAMARSYGISGSQIKSWDATIANLPEPGAAGLLTIAGFTLLKRRRIRIA